MENKFGFGRYEIFQKCRSWLDNETYVIPIFRRNSPSDEFAERILENIERVMEREKFCYQNGKTVIPMEYIVFLSEKDGYDWYGVKRDLLRRKLETFVRGRLQMLSLDTFNKEVVHIQATREVSEGDVKVIHRWADSDDPVNIWFNSNLPFSICSDDLESLLEERLPESRRQDLECETAIKQRLERFFCLEIEHASEMHKIPVFQPRVTLGRATTADICLQGDLEISRRHMVLSRKEEGGFDITATGRNPVFVGGKSIYRDQKANCRIGDRLGIGSYAITITS